MTPAAPSSATRRPTSSRSSSAISAPSMTVAVTRRRRRLGVPRSRRCSTNARARSIRSSPSVVDRLTSTRLAATRAAAAARIAAAAASPRRFGFPCDGDLGGELGDGRSALGDRERDVRRARERLADQRVAHLRLELLRHPHRREDVLVGDRVLDGQRRRPVAQRLGLRDGAGRAVPVVREAGRHRRERGRHLGHEGGDRAPARRRRLRGDRVEQLLEGHVRVGHGGILLDQAPRRQGPRVLPSNRLLLGGGQNRPTVVPLSSMSTSKAAGFTPRPGIVCMSPRSGTSQPEPV